MSESIRVLQVMSTLGRGGAETVVMEWLRRIDREQFSFDFIVNDDGIEHAYEREALDLGCRIVRAPRFKLWNLFPYITWWYRCLKLHEEWRIIHAQNTIPAFVYLSVARLLGRTTIAHSHAAGGLQGRLLYRLKELLLLPLRWIAHVRLACSRAAADWMFGDKTSARVIPNGIDLARFAYSIDARLATRNQLGLTSEFTMGHVGSFHEPKNHTRLLRIFAAVLEHDPSAKLILVGDGHLRRQIEGEIAALGISGAVILTGLREDIPDVMAAMDVLVLPSHYEGLPVVLVEAQASGLPCVVSDAVTREVALTDLVRFASLSEPDDSWADAILDTRSSGVRRSRIEQLRIAGYDSAQVARELQDLYMELSQGRG